MRALGGKRGDERLVFWRPERCLLLCEHGGQITFQQGGHGQPQAGEEAAVHDTALVGREWLVDPFP